MAVHLMYGFNMFKISTYDKHEFMPIPFSVSAMKQYTVGQPFCDNNFELYFFKTYFLSFSVCTKCNGEDTITAE